MAQDKQDGKEWRDTKRQVGCLWGCLTEPFVIGALMVGSIFGAYSIGRKAERARLKQAKTDRSKADD